jgi:uncharacterized membrane protein
MQLPDIAIPLTLPFGVPLMLHPAVVHFAMALPVVVLALELANLLFKRRALSVTSLVLLLLTVFVYLAAYFTGKADGSEAFQLLGPDAQAELKAHRILGTYLAYGLLVPLVFKLTAMLLRQKWARGALIVTLVMFISFMFKQGYDGGELVYKHGVNVKAVTLERERAVSAHAAIEELNVTVAEQNATIGTLKAGLNACKKQEESGIGQAVDKAISSVKNIFSEDNETNTTSSEVSGQEAAPADANDTNGSN